MWDRLLTNIARKDVILTESEIEILKLFFTVRKFRKHQFILQEGETAHHDNFIVKGLARTYKIDENGALHILRFTPEDWWTGDLQSFLTAKPTQYNVDCMEDTEVLRISLSDLNSLFDRVPAMNKYFRILYQNSLISFNERLASTLSKTALERYEEFVSRYPHIEQRVPNHQIAAYLGIKPQSLSRIRGQFQSRKK